MLHEQVYRSNFEIAPVTRSCLSREGTVEAAFLMCVGLAVDQNGGIGDDYLEEAMEQESLSLPRRRNDIEWEITCEVPGYKTPRDHVRRYT